MVVSLVLCSEHPSVTLIRRLVRFTGPVITLDLKAGQAMIIDQVRKCPNNVCASIPVA